MIYNYNYLISNYQITLRPAGAWHSYSLLSSTNVAPPWGLMFVSAFSLYQHYTPLWLNIRFRNFSFKNVTSFLTGRLYKHSGWLELAIRFRILQLKNILAPEGRSVGSPMNAYHFSKPQRGETLVPNKQITIIQTWRDERWFIIITIWFQTT